MHKNDAKDKKKRSLLKDVQIREVSFVGRGANQGARQSLFKTEDLDDVLKRLFAEVMRDMQASEEAEKLLGYMLEATKFLKHSLAEIMADPRIEQRKDMLRQSVQEFASAMSSMIDNAQLTKEFMKMAGKTEDGKEFPASDYAYVPDAEKPSTWKLRLTSTPGEPPDVHIVGAAVAALGEGFRGQKVQIPASDRAKVVARVRAAWLKANKGKDEKDLPAILKTNDTGDLDMDKVEELTKKVDDLVVRLAKSELRGSMTDAHKAHYDSLEGEAQEAFGKASPAERDAILKKIKDADETLTVEGVTVRKSDVGDATFEIMKRQQARIDKEAADAKAERETRIQKELEVEAEALWPHLPGTKEEKAGLLKSIKAMPKETADKQLANMKASDEAMAKQLKELGQGGQTDDSSATAKLDKMAKELAGKENITFAKAYTKVLDTEEGAKLYQESLAKK